MTDQNFRALNAELGFPPEAADRLLHDRRADERREKADKFALARERWPYANEFWWNYITEHGDPRT